MIVHDVTLPCTVVNSDRTLVSLQLFDGHPISGGRLNIKMSSYQYRDPHVKDKMVSRPFYP